MKGMHLEEEGTSFTRLRFDRFWCGHRGGGRCYGIIGGNFVKSVETPCSSADMPEGSSLEKEFAVLRECSGLPGIPVAKDFVEADHVQTLILQRVEGAPLSQAEMSATRSLIVWGRLLVILVRLAWRGISHNDVRADNVLISRSGCVFLVDFDQASRGGFVSCLAASLLALGPHRARVRSSLLGLARDQVQMTLPPRAIRLLHAITSRLGGGRPRPTALDAADLALLSDIDAGRLQEAWCAAATTGASSPGQAIAYCELPLGAVLLPGERSWPSRWAYLRLAARCRGRRVLELGCNMALLSTFLLKVEGARAALAVDRDPEILDAAAEVATAFRVRPEFRRVDFDRDAGWEETLAAFGPDVVFALSVLNWVEDKSRFLAFLARFEEVVFEGHERGSVERRRLRAAGFREVELICSSERGRPVFLCRK